MKKPKTTTETPAPKVKAKEVVAPEAAQTKPKKPSPDQAPGKKVQTATAKPVATTQELPMPERIGMTAGSIWHYLDKNGVTPVATLVRELPEEEKIIHRSIGWLAQERKITLDTSGRVETIALIERA